MKITQRQLRQIIKEELFREAMSDDDDTVVPPSDILSKTYGGPGPVDDFGDSDDEEFEEFPILPNSYDILETISAGGLMRNMKKVSSGGAGPTAQTASAWLKYLNENKADAEAILHKAIYETLNKAAAMGRIAMNDKKANMRWDVQEFYALPSGDINETRRKRR